MNVTNRVNDIERKLLKSEDFVEESNVIVSDRDRELVEAIRWECISRGHKVGYARNPVTFDYDFNTIVVTHTKNKFMSVAERLAYKRYVKLWDKNRDIMEQTLRSVMKEFDSRNSIYRDILSKSFLIPIWKLMENSGLSAEEIEEFLIAATAKALKRVVIEIPEFHPLSNLNEAWKHFWNLERPTQPSADLLFEITKELGFASQMVKWDGELRNGIDFEQVVEFNRIRLCLPKSRIAEVRDYMVKHPSNEYRPLATIWWNK